MVAEKITHVWPEWVAEKALGKGSYGTVYKAVRTGNNITSQAAIKVISIPSDTSELDSLRSEGLTEESAKTYFRGIVDDFVSEIQLMEVMKGVQNIVSVEDYKVVEKSNEIGWDIYIRMELLTPFNTYICNNQMTEEDVIKLGIDICTALEICSRCSIIHRDIKPENIFINDFGYFKLGDFGIAKKLENATGNMSQKGTYNYMAPEIAMGKNYDARVDLYSLGIVLYRLLNNNRLPFIENEQQLLNPNARKEAVERRLRGDRMLPPCQASSAVADVIMRACAYDPKDRFKSATEMKRALSRVDLGMDKVVVTSQPAVEDDMDKTYRVRPAAETLNNTVGLFETPAARTAAPAPAAAPAAPGKLIMNFNKGKKVAPPAASVAPPSPAPAARPAAPVYAPPAPRPAAPAYAPPVPAYAPPAPTYAPAAPARVPASVPVDKSVGSSMSVGFNGWHQATPLTPSAPKPASPAPLNPEVNGDIPAPTVDSVPRRDVKSPFGTYEEKK